MRINHNIQALNTYRQLMQNQNTTSKHLERLSSGLRINRAADDAAGLAISEKMRSQIRGLKVAERNCMDGISLIQTAEGALNEVHAILQRMRELTTQASNDTYTTQDRYEIQGEINQLTSEINRIANTTEFNTNKLLKGGIEIDISGDMLEGGVDAIVHNATAAVDSDGVDDVAAEWDSDAVTKMADDASDTITFNGVTVTLATAGAAVPPAVTNDTTASVTVANGGTVEDQLNGIVSALEAARDYADGDLTDNALYGFTFSVSGTGAAAKLMISDSTTHGAANNAQAITLGGTSALNFTNLANSKPGVTGVSANGDITFADVPTEGAMIAIADKVIGFYDSTSSNYVDEVDAKSDLGADYVVDINALADGAAVPSAVVAAVNAAGGITGYSLTDATGGQLDIDADAVGGFSGTTFLDVSSDQAAETAKGTIMFTNIPSEGNKISVADKTIGFWNSNLTTYPDAAEAQSQLGVDCILDVASMTSIKEAGEALANLDMSLNPPSPAVSLNDNGAGVVTIAADLAGVIGNSINIAAGDDTSGNLELDLQIGANTGQSFTIEFDDIRSVSLNISSKNGGEVTSVDGIVTAMFTNEKVITKGTDNIAIEYALDVTSHDKASNALTILDEAMNMISSRRSKLGAYQNRLEHTINNLNAASENLTAAESRIRDADMALEMTEFTKNNIINQAATSMLAQANQLPQGILKLLQ